MDDETDDLGGAATLSVEQAAAAYAKSQTAKELQGQPAAEDDEQGDNADDLSEAGDEPADGEEDGEPDPTSEAEDDSETDPQTASGRFVAHDGRVKLPQGGETTVSELIAGYMKDGDYRQKTTDVSRQRDEIAARSSALSQKEQQLTEQLNYANALLQSFMPQQPDPSHLESDPLTYMRDKENYERMAAHLNYIGQTLQANAQRGNAEREQERQKTIQTERAKLLDALPHLKDETKLRAFVADLQAYAPKWGLTQEDLAAIPSNHAYAVIMEKAIRWDKLQASKPKVQKQIENRPPVARGGKRPTPQENQARAASELRNKAKQTGRVEDAAAAYFATRSR